MQFPVARLVAFVFVAIVSLFAVRIGRINGHFSDAASAPDKNESHGSCGHVMAGRGATRRRHLASARLSLPPDERRWHPSSPVGSAG